MKILGARKANDVTSLRVLSKPSISLNFGTTSYCYDMIDWPSVEISSPPVLQNMTDAELIIRVAKKILAIQDFPCHSQGVEILLKEVTQASAIVSDKKSRHSLIISSAKSKKKFPNLDSKQDFV